MNYRNLILDETDGDALLLLFAEDYLNGKPKKTQSGGSLPGKAANVDRDRISGHRRLMDDYFNENSTYD